MATAKSSLGRARALVPSARQRNALIKRLSAVTDKMTTAVLTAMDDRHEWYRQLGAEERSWISVLARAGIDGFYKWFADEKVAEYDPAALFRAAPRALTRRITLHETVELVRTTIDVVEEQIDTLIPRGDRPVLQIAVVHYSREIAFAAAGAYARAAELRGSWDERIEALVVDAVVRADTDDSVLSRASTLGWMNVGQVFVAVGPASQHGDSELDEMRRAAGARGLQMLVALQGGRLVCIIAGRDIETPPDCVRAMERLVKYFGDGPIVVGLLAEDLITASASAREAMSGARAAAAWPEGPPVLLARDLLPERALAGHGHARRELVRDVFDPLRDAGGDLLQTCASLLDHGGSVEATARSLYVHANTVRYRIKRIQDVTNYSPTDPRGSYVLRLAVTLGRLQAR